MPYGQSTFDQDRSAWQGMGQSMMNVMSAQQQGGLRAQQFAAQQALEQAYLRLAQEKQVQEMLKQKQEGPLREAQTANYTSNTAAENQKVRMANEAASRSQMMGRLQGFRGAPNPMAMVADPYNGPQIMGDLRQANVLPQGQVDLSQEQLMQAVNAALQGQTFQSATATPAGAGHMLMNPYQQGHLQEVGRHNQVLEGVAQGRNKIAQERNILLDSPEERRRREAMNILGRFLMQPEYKQTGGSELNSALSDFTSGGKSSGGGAVKRVSSKNEYDLLPPGTHYIDPNGVPGVKGQ